MIASLRSRLIAAFASIIFLSLFLAGGSFVVLLRDYQVQLAINQLADLSLPLSYQVSVLERAGADEEQIGQFLEDQAAEVQVRMLLVDTQGVVLRDTARILQGQPLRIQEARPLSGIRNTYWGSRQEENGQWLFVAAPIPPPGRLTIGGLTVRQPSYGVVLAVPESSVSGGWPRLARTLSAAAAISLLVSIAVAFFLARSISGPIAQMTRASEQIARGNYDQHIETGGRDEVARLADSFNRMSREVAASHRTLRDFLANVSHELRTPLTSIQGFSQAMVDGAIREPEDYAEAGRIIGEETERMRRLVDELMSLSRLESGQVKMERSLLDVGELIRVALHRAQRYADERGLRLEAEVAKLPPVRGDNHWLEQILANLLDNAIRYTPAGGTVTVRAQPETFAEPGNGHRGPAAQSGISVCVHNTGSYIPPEDLPRVFERFYQVDRSRANGHSGLGLAIVREIAQAHGGRVEAASNAELGTSFVVRLPAASERTAADWPPVAE